MPIRAPMGCCRTMFHGLHAEQRASDEVITLALDVGKRIAAHTYRVRFDHAILLLQVAIRVTRSGGGGVSSTPTRHRMQLNLSTRLHADVPP